MSNESFFYVLSALAEGTRDVSDDVLAVLFAENLVKECAGLLVVVVGVLVGVPTGGTLHWVLVPGVLLVFDGTSGSAGLVVLRAASI